LSKIVPCVGCNLFFLDDEFLEEVDPVFGLHDVDKGILILIEVVKEELFGCCHVDLHLLLCDDVLQFDGWWSRLFRLE